MPEKITVDINDVAKRATMTVKLRGVRRFRFRLWLTIILLRVVAWVWVGEMCAEMCIEEPT